MRPKKKRLDISRLFPLGVDYEQTLAYLILGLLVAACTSIVIYSIAYQNASDHIYQYITYTRVVSPGAIMTDFRDLLGLSLTPYYMGAFVCLFQVFANYRYHTQDSKPIYLMRRLPRPSEYWVRLLGAPLGGAALCLALAFVTLVLFYLSYMAATPDACIAPGQWQKLWMF